MAGKIRTVAGDIDAPDGAVLVHEHLQIDLSHNKGPQTVLGPGDIDDIVHDLIDTRQKHDLSLVADLSTLGSGRDVEALRRISDASGVAVVAATGLYWDPVHEDVLNGTEDSLRRQMAREIDTGVGATGIRCGVIKIGTDRGTPPEPVARLFHAAAMVSRDTGAAVVTHTSTPDQAQWQIDRLEEGGADFSRVLISHLHNFGSIEKLAPQARRGVRFGFDQIGFAKGPTYEDYAALVLGAIAAGFADQMMVASDVARRARLLRHGGTSYGTLFSQLHPLLRARGLSEASWRRLTHDNPVALLAMAS